LSAILNLYFRSPIVTFFVALILFQMLAFVLALHNLEMIQVKERLEISVKLVTGVGVLLLGLTGWFFFVFCRTRIQEFGGTARALSGLLFGIAAVEVFFTILLCNLRDLAFIVFGL